MIVVARYDRPDIETIAAAVARSQIIVAAPAKRLPAGYEAVDVAILDWIVGEGQCLGRRYLPM
jgi:hypothetical protein